MGLSVDQVFELIERMPEADRMALEKRLSQRLEAEWNEAVAENRRIAETRGITDETVGARYRAPAPPGSLISDL